MAGIIFPDFARAIGGGMALRQQQQQADMMDEERAAKAEIAPLIPKALQGDKEALNQIGARHPDTFTKLMPMLQSMETNQRAKLKETSDWTTRAAMGVLSLPENERPAAYQAALADGQRLGYKIDMPPQYDRAVEGRLKHILNQARPIADYWKNQGENVQAMPPLDGGGMAPPAAGPGGSVIDRSRAASASLESGGRYDAVGPVVNAKGNRAYGAHQVMDFNIGPWTQEVLGKAMTPQQFLADQKAQDAVYNAKMGQYIQKYGSPEAAARAWFAGEGGMNNRNATDVLGTSVQGYGQRFAQAYGDGAFGAGPQPTMGTAPPSMVASGSNAAPMPQPPGGMAVPGTPAPMPQPPGLAQGDAAPRADASGNPLPPQQQNAREILTIRQFVHSQIPGASPLTVNGFPAYDKNGRLGIQLPNGQRDFIDVPKPKEPGADKGLFGDSLTGRALTVLRSADPTSQEYAMAYALMSKPQVITDPSTGTPTVIQPMDLSMFPKPGFVGGGQPAPVAAPAGIGPTQPPAAAAPQPVPIPGGGQMTVMPAPDRGPGKKQIDELNAAKGEAVSIVSTLEAFRDKFKNASNADRAKSLLGGTTALNTSYNVASLLAKGEQLFNLGVLNGPDLEILRKVLPDPSTIKGGIASTADADAAIDEVIDLIQTRITTKERNLKLPETDLRKVAKDTRATQPGAKSGTYMGPDNKPVSWQEIEATAKNRGMTPDEVVRALGLQPTGMQ